jgi:tRNA A37 threonylcarbamoyladenosine dehydratase
MVRRCILMKIEAVQQCSLGGTDIENEFIIIGAGGTGGHLIPNLARLISIINNGNDHHRLTIIDGDEVETKNISRQNFIHRDVGKNKAEVLGQRYSSAFGIPIRVIPNYLEDVIELESLINSTQKRPIIIGCVDNNKTRKLIHKVFFKYSNRRDIIWIDSGKVIA